MMVMLKVKMKLGAMWAKMMIDMKSVMMMLTASMEVAYQLLVKYLAIELVVLMMGMLKVKMKLGTMWAKLMADTKAVMMMVTALMEVAEQLLVKYLAIELVV